MKLLIDADYIAYKSCAGAESEIDYGEDLIVVISRFSEAMRNIERDLTRIKDQFPFHSGISLHFSGPENFRKKIFPAYKGHRNRKKPCGYKRCIEELKERYHVVHKVMLEADDSLGIAATLDGMGDCIIVSPDKDMKQIPGRHYNFTETFEVTPEEGRKWHLLQTVAGDNTDGYTGVPGMGLKKAEALFDNLGYTWAAVLEAFTDKGLTEEDALVNARLAKILTSEDYDFKQREPIPWNPSPDYRADSRTELQAKTDGAAARKGRQS